MAHAISDDALDTVLRTARSHSRWQDKPVSAALLMAIYDLMRMGPTASNTCPARIVFVTSEAAKARLKPHLDAGNVAKTMSAPATAIIGYDLDFPARMPILFPSRPQLKDAFADPAARESVAFRNGTLQGAYFIIAARALGLDCGPMSGFDNAGVDAEFFAGTKIKSNFICALGYADPAGLYPRLPRLSFDAACAIV
jgi:3-hydroxypropanoate dehydrogenase